MKTFNALLATATLALAAGFAQADVRPDLIPGLLKYGAIADFEKLNQAAQAKHPGATITDTELEQAATGGYIYKVDLLGSDSVKWDVKLDAKTGAVLHDKKDT